MAITESCPIYRKAPSHARRGFSILYYRLCLNLNSTATASAAGEEEDDYSKDYKPCAAVRAVKKIA